MKKRIKLETHETCVRYGEVLPSGMTAYALSGNDGTGYLHYGKCRGTVRVEKENPDIELVKAEQQFTGFDHLFKGGDVISLVQSMGLKAEEWEQLKVNMPWLAKELVQQVNDHFSVEE